MVGGKSGKSPYDLTKKGSGIFVNKNFNADLYCVEILSTVAFSFL